MKRHLYVALFFLFTGAGCISEQTEKQKGGDVSVGDRLPSFAVTLPDGRTVNDESLSGQILLIILFSTECKDCQAQLPVIESIWETYRDDEEVLVFGISRAEGETMVSDYWKRTGLTLPYSAQDDKYLYSLFAQSGVPRIYISDGDRIVRFSSSDKPLATEAQLVAVIEGLKK